MAAPLIVRLVMDAAGYLKTVDTAVASNTKLEESSLGVGKAMALSADQQVAASLKATRALETQIAGQRALAADATKSAEVRTRANLLADRSQARLNSSLGLSSTAFAGSSRAVQTGERDLGKFTRGALAGSGAASSLGRSLAFASTGFIAIAGGATLITSSIKAALDLAKTQRQVEAQLKTGGKSWDQYGQRIDQADLKLSHISGFTNQELLQGFGYLIRVNNNVGESLKLTSEAADVARGRNISLATAAIALAKAQGGSVTALRRLGIVVPKGVEGLKALAFVQEKFAGQAAAGATVADRFHASLVNTEEIIGTALLPTFTRLTTEIGDWLAKMNESGRLQRDVNEAVSLGGTVFHTLGGAIGIVDKITGGFGKTLKILFEIYLGRKIVLALIGVDKLAASWAGVTTAANTATAAEERATAVAAGAGAKGLTGAAAGADAGLLGGLAARRAAKQATQQAEQSAALRSRIAPYINTAPGLAAETSAAEAGVTGVGTAAVVAEGKVTSLSSSLAGLGALVVAPIVIPIILNYSDKFNNATRDTAFGRHFGFLTTPLLHPRRLFDQAFQDTGSKSLSNFFTATGKLLSGESIDRTFRDINNRAAADARKADLAAAKQQFGALFTTRGARFAPGPLPLKGGGSVPFTPQGFGLTPTAGPPPLGPFGKATPIAVYAKYTQTITEQLAVAQAALTKTTKDDVATAKRIIARIKRLIDQGHLAGASLVQALQDEATQQGVLDNARQAAAAQAAKVAAAKQAAASSYTTPIDLQLAEARAQLTASTKDDVRVEKQILAAAKAALASGTKNKQGQLAALQVMLQAKQAIQSLATQTASTFTLPLKLQLELAKAQALGTDQTRILLKMKAALERALKNAKGNIQKQIDIWNQIASINQQLGSSAQSAFGTFKQASTRALTAGLGLTPAQRKQLRSRLSQLGPGGTVPGNGVGAGGFIIGPDGRPVQVHQHRRPGDGRIGGDGQQVSPARFNRLIRTLERSAHRPIHVTVDLDGRIIADSTTRYQQRRRRRNPTQRRGPNAATSA